MAFFQWARTLFSLKSPCHNTPMSTSFDPLGDRMVYTCKKCKKEYI